MEDIIKGSLVEKGKELLQKNNYAEAAALLQEGLKKTPTDIDLLIMLGLSLEKSRNPSKARDIYFRALDFNPTLVKAHQGLARLSLQGPHYLEALKKIHQNLQPQNYVEVGIRDGASFKLANSETIAIGIDPNPLVTEDQLPGKHKIIQDTSDNYFNSNHLSIDLDGQPVDLAFIDGMHRFEFALRDFIALEKSSHPGATILVHDCYPLNELTARREQETPFWSGDVWKLILCLKEYRTDLNIITLPCPPTGIAVITNLDPLSTVLSDSLEKICDTFVPMDFSVIEEKRREKLNLFSLSEALESCYLKGVTAPLQLNVCPR